jgi:type VII secretion-associated serine protease mycosin
MPLQRVQRPIPSHHRVPRLVLGSIALILALSLFRPVPGYADRPQPQVEHYRSLNPVTVENGPGYVPGEVLVKLAPDTVLQAGSGVLITSSTALAEVLVCFGFDSAREVLPGIYKLSAPVGTGVDVQAAVAALQATGAVSYAGPNHLYHAMLAPNDSEYVAGQQWGLTQIKAEQAWDITTGSSDIIIALLDTGVATDHPDLGKFVPGYDFVNNDSDPYDDHGHGTYTAGIAAAQTNNGQGVAGVAWGARIMPVKVLGARGQGSEEAIGVGIRWAVDHGARIISMSLGGDEDSPVMRDAVQYASDHNVLIVASAGNTPDGKPNYPAAYDPVLAVGASGRNDTYTGFSSWGPYVDVTAPGVGILSTAWDNGTLTYEYGNGTSASCPFVSGVAALIWSVNPNLTAAQVKQIIEDSSDDQGDPGWDEHYGYGRLNALRAVQMAMQGPRPTRTPTPTPAGQPTATPVPGATRPPAQGPSLQVNTTQAVPGGLLGIVGNGFAPDELIDLSLTLTGGDRRSIGNAQTNGQGSFRAEVALPTNLAPGKATLSATGSKSGLRASLELTISPGGPGRGGQSTIKGIVRGANPDSVTVRLKPSLGVSGPELTTKPNNAGQYSFTNLAAGFYSLSASASGALPAGPFSVQVDGTAADMKTIDITLALSRPKAFDPVPAVAGNPALVYFPAVGHTLKGPFLKYWRDNGGLPIFGYPISEEFTEVSPTDGKEYVVQYFERNRFEYHPEYAGTSSEVLMGLLGVEMTRGRTFQPGQSFQSDPNRLYFSETRHSLSGAFLRYWRSHGGLAIFGYPISEELVERSPTDGKEYVVQYFERNRFEYHPEYAGTSNEVLLGLLGVEIARRNGWVP